MCNDSHRTSTVCWPKCRLKKRARKPKHNWVRQKEEKGKQRETEEKKKKKGIWTESSLLVGEGPMKNERNLHTRRSLD